MKQNNRATGQEYESLAMEYLISRGYEIIERNFYARHGELDIIARNNGYLCFVEVKYRASARYGSAAEAITFAKKRSICLSAREYLWKKRIPDYTPVRFDVVTIQGSSITLYENAFEYMI